MNADAELLLGILAFQLNFVDRPQLLAGFDAWAQQPQRPLGAIFVEQQAITADERELLEALRQKHLGRFNQDVAKSLAALTPVAESARHELQAHLDRSLHASLAQFGADRVEDAFATAARGPSASRPPKARGSASCGPMPRAAWAKSTSPTTRSCIARWRSSRFRARMPTIPKAEPGSCSRPRSPAGWSIRASCRSTAWAPTPTAGRTTPCVSSAATA